MKDELGSLYWVISHRCNTQCDHCYMSCGPAGNSLSLEDTQAVIDNLPRRINYQIILSGGEVLHPKNRGLLYFVADGLQRKYGRRPLTIQTNGDFINRKTIKECLEYDITHLSISAMDHHHNSRYNSLNEKAAAIRRVLKEEGFAELNPRNNMTPKSVGRRLRLIKGFQKILPWLRFKPTFTFWGADQDFWLGDYWARGEALKNGIACSDKGHNFCRLWSGGKHFLEAGSPRQEVAIQLSYAFPCCPASRVSLADLRKESLTGALNRASHHPAFRAINNGQPYGVDSFGRIDTSWAKKRLKKLNNICLMCDELMFKTAKDDFVLSPFSVYK